MYPYLRLWHQFRTQRHAPPLGLLEPHISRHRIWPLDLDPWGELNNGRTLTLFDLGRVPMLARIGFVAAARAKGWRLTVAGNTLRYRRRVTLFQVLTQRSRVLGWDARFFYLQQSFYSGAECTASMLCRVAVASGAGLVDPGEMALALGADPRSPALPDWVQAWIAADATRPWPPQE